MTTRLQETNLKAAKQEAPARRWLTNLLLAAGVILTVVMALLMSQLDDLQRRLPAAPTSLPVANLTATANAPLPAVPLPSATPPVTPTATTPRPQNGENATAVAVLPQCHRIPAGWIIYTVQPGDDLLSLSIQSGATIHEIRQANCLQQAEPLPGMALYLPPQPPTRPPCGPPPHWVRYTVQRGDNLFRLALNRGTTIYAIMTANCLSSQKLIAGRQIYLPPLLVTPTWTATATQAPTPIPTLLPTAEPTRKPQPPTVTAPPPATPTPTLTATPTSTELPPTPTPPLPTATPTPTPIVITSTPLPPPTPTSTATATNTPSPTQTPTSLPTATLTPTATATTAPTPTPTPTPTETPPP